MPQNLIDEYSAAAVPVELSVFGSPLGIASGFFWKKAEELFLVTNWHNLAGVNPITGVNLSSTGGRPDTIKAGIHGARLPRRGELTLPLWDDNGPLWMVHPKFGRRVDVAALPVPTGVEGEYQARFYPINTLSSRRMQVSIGGDVFILGYPFSKGLEDRGGWPVWKRASVATEPALMLRDEMYFLVDTASRPGMSGAPVIARSTGDVLLEDGSLVMVTGTSTRLIGVYAGRVSSADAEDAQLGRVFPIDLLEEIIDAQMRETGV
ncbi:MAG: trypsin-like peptidase domain-containing protein [Pseudomonadota bacterium]